MTRTQIQLPDELYREAKRVAAEQEITLAEVIRRGLEQTIRMYPPRGDAGAWQPPCPSRLGKFSADAGHWRELANQ